MSRFMLSHHHEPHECGVVFASFKAFASPLRGSSVRASCDFGTHHIWWEAEAPSEDAALAQLPHYVAERTHAVRILERRTP
jgi:hypothetical protein